MNTSHMTVHALITISGSDILSKVIKLLVGGVGFLGAAMIVFGAVLIGINVSGASNAGGSQLAQGIGTVVGGVIIAASAVYFGFIDVSWIN